MTGQDVEKLFFSFGKAKGLGPLFLWFIEQQDFSISSDAPSPKGIDNVQRNKKSHD